MNEYLLHGIDEYISLRHKLLILTELAIYDEDILLTLKVYSGEK